MTTLATTSPSLKAWFIAGRPWSLTAAFTPVALGCSLAWYSGSFNFFYCLLMIVAGLFMQLATNFFNTYGDFISGVDTIESASTCPQLVTGSMIPSAMFRAGLLCLVPPLLIGIFFVWQIGWPIAAYSLLGFSGCYYYTNGAYPYKYYGIGPLFVFLLMGPLMVCPAHYIHTGVANITPLFISLSIGFLVAAIMHANDLRDIAYDKAAGIKTFAMTLGLHKSIRAYAYMNFAAFAVLLLGFIIKIIPALALLPFILLPTLIKTLAKLNTPGCNTSFLEAWAAKFHMSFGLLLILGIILTGLLQRYN